MSPTALLYPSGIDKCPWQYRKINRRWHRRPVNTGGDWSALSIEYRVDSTNEWTWS